VEQSGIFYIPCYALLNLDKMEKVNWRKQYKLDNIFNLVILIMCLVLIFLEESKICLVPIGVGLFVNISAYGYFNAKKYE
jgi:hypothetical protein